jgi:hypothetical protein
MEHRWEVDAKCPKRCGAKRINLFAWCFCPVCELRCPACKAVKTVSGRWGMKLIDREIERMRAEAKRGTK